MQQQPQWANGLGRLYKRLKENNNWRVEEQYLLRKENYEGLEKLKLALEEHVEMVKEIIDKFRVVCQCLISSHGLPHSTSSGSGTEV